MDIINQVFALILIIILLLLFWMVATQNPKPAVPGLPEPSKETGWYEPEPAEIESHGCMAWG